MLVFPGWYDEPAPAMVFDEVDVPGNYSRMSGIAADLVEQLPIVPNCSFKRIFGTKTAEEIVREDVLHLTYTSHDMATFARDQGYEGAPIPWQDDDRLRRRARLDAIFFHLYGLERDAAQYVLGTFPIVQREEEERYDGRFRSRELILGYMAALAAGNPYAPVVG
jgi:hypothetical protein